MKLRDLFRKKNKEPFRRDNPLGIEGPAGAGPSAADNTSDIVSFAYRYNGSIGGDSYSCTVERKDDGCVFSCQGMMWREFGKMSLPADPALLRQLKEMYLRLRLAEWDGFSQFARHVMDGDGFDLTIRFADGGRLEADGTNAYPPRYAAFCKERDALLRPLIDAALAQAREEKIRQGIAGTLNSVLACFIQRGTAGEDRYKFILWQAEDSPTARLEAEIKSVSGQYFDKGEYTYYTQLDKQYVDMEGIDKLLRACDAMRWYDWNEHLESQNNSEWFQFCFGFTGGTRISAMGSRHPDGYDNFREGFLTLCAQMIRRAEQEAGLQRK